jgi:hypothetical protein
MATQCIDISADKNLTQSSPISMFAFIICFIITNLFMKPDFLYVIVVLVELILCQILFQFSVRMVYLTIIFLFRETLMSPTSTDVKYHPDENSLVAMKKILSKKKKDKYE